MKRLYRFIDNAFIQTMINIFNDPLILGFITSVIFLACLFIYAFYYILKKQIEIQRKERRIEKEAAMTIEKAQQHAEQIIAEAAKSAQDLLKETKSFKDGIEKDLKTSLDTEVNDYKSTLNEKLSTVLTNYQKVLSQTGNFYADSIKEAGTLLKDMQQKNAESFKNVVEDETLSAKFYIQRKVNEEIEKANKEIEEYKKDQQKRIQESLRKLIINLSEEVFEGSLTMEQQEKLILRALEEAKKNNVLII